MAINKKLIHFEKYSDFIGNAGTNGVTSPTNGYYHNIPEKSIVFIKDVLKIWTHGQEYDCSSLDLSEYITESELDTVLLNYIKDIKVNGTSVISNNVGEIPKATTNILGVTILSDATNSNSTSHAATANAVKKAYDLANSKTSNVGTITEIKMNGDSKGTSGIVDLGTVITEHLDISGKLDTSTANATYLTITSAQSLYLGKTAQASSAVVADSATKASQDANGNVITTTYATKSEISDFITSDTLDDYVTTDTINTLREEIIEYDQVNADAIATKQDIISDLDTIRSGAALGATALLSIPSDYVTSSELSDFASTYVTATTLSSILEAYLQLSGGILTGSLTTKSILPDADDSYDLGSSDTRWGRFFTVDAFINNADISGSLLPSTTSTSSTTGIDLGSTSKRWKTIYSYYLNVSGYVGSNLLPQTDGTASTGYNLGSSSYRWKLVYGYQGNFENSLTVGTSLLPGTANSGATSTSCNLGSSTYYWNLVYTRLLTTGGQITSGGGIYPSTTSTLYLGGSSNQWAGIYAVAGTFSGNVTAANLYSNYGVINKTTISSLPTSYKLIMSTISASASFSFDLSSSTIANTKAGLEVHVIIKNSSTSSITITLPTSSYYVTLGESSLTIAASGYAEVNALYDGSKIYLRGIS